MMLSGLLLKTFPPAPATAPCSVPQRLKMPPPSAGAAVLPVMVALPFSVTVPLLTKMPPASAAMLPETVTLFRVSELPVLTTMPPPLTALPPVTASVLTVRATPERIASTLPCPPPLRVGAVKPRRCWPVTVRFLVILVVPVQVPRSHNVAPAPAAFWAACRLVYLAPDVALMTRQCEVAADAAGVQATPPHTSRPSTADTPTERGLLTGLPPLEGRPAQRTSKQPSAAVAMGQVRCWQPVPTAVIVKLVFKESVMKNGTIPL